MRTRAVLKALYHGLLPYWCYEKVRHYECSYLQHLVVNLKYAFRWIIGKQQFGDIRFELTINKDGDAAN